MVLSTATLQQCSIQSQDAGSRKEQRQEKCFYVLNITLIDNNKIMVVPYFSVRSSGFYIEGFLYG